MTAADILRRHLAELTDVTGVTGDVVEADDRLYVILHKVPVPENLFQLDQSDVLYMTDRQYPFSAMDMFWTELDLLRKDGSIPQGADVIETYLNRTWRRFSWHRQGAWNPGGNPLLDHYALMEARWAAEERLEAA
jgi:hypothetical protein